MKTTKCPAKQILSSVKSDRALLRTAIVLEKRMDTLFCLVANEVERQKSLDLFTVTHLMAQHSLRLPPLSPLYNVGMDEGCFHNPMPAF